MEGKLSCWKGKLMPIGGRLILIKSSLSSIPMYMMLFYPLPEGPKECMDFFTEKIFLGGGPRNHEVPSC
jgi:hypothetical protein